MIGGGLTGLEAALTLARRGVEVTLAEAGTEFGGRVAREARLPGLTAWGRVRDWRLGHLAQHTTCQMFLDSRIDADTAFEFGADHILVATRAGWRRDGVGRAHRVPLELGDLPLFTPGDLVAGRLPQSNVVIYDDDHHYMAGVLAGLCVATGLSTRLVTPAAEVAPFTQATLEQDLIEARLLDLGVAFEPRHRIDRGGGGRLILARTVGPASPREATCDGLVLVTSRAPGDALYRALADRRGEWADHRVTSVARAGDCDAPPTIAAAVWAGHRHAREPGLAADDIRLSRAFF